MQQPPPPPRSIECIQRRYFGVKRHLAPPPQHYHQRSPIRPQYPVSAQAQAQIRQRRPYHSHFQSVFPTTHEYTHSQTAILSAALEHVPEHGFTLEALTLGARDAGFLDVSVQLFSRREFDLVLFWLASRRGLLKGKVEEEEEGLFDNVIDEDTRARGNNTSRLSVDEKVKVLVMERLRMNEKIVHRWQDALALMSFPTNVPLSLSELHTLSSDILYLAGDTSVDASWYTKRLSLSTIYASAEFFMTQDASPDFTATEAFVDRRIEDNKAISEKIKNVKQCLRVMAGTAVGLGRSWGMKL
ncbi:hypothetical protein Egran_00333 [Elaphomyces granulatus]|uniref:Ubiquinone biosynthesis protein n=1 Tax=Elaphomyces granulatus TaxID=519963 RepID=A0A232M690_9EURO|nr:hypothetical protein Egran_00333 [Elaphomyces granulatus]